MELSDELTKNLDQVVEQAYASDLTRFKGLSKPQIREKIIAQLEKREKQEQLIDQMLEKAEKAGLYFLDWNPEGTTDEEIIAEMDNLIAEHKAEEAKNQT